MSLYQNQLKSVLPSDAKLLKIKENQLKALTKKLNMIQNQILNTISDDELNDLISNEKKLQEMINKLQK